MNRYIPRRSSLQRFLHGFEADHERYTGVEQPEEDEAPPMVPDAENERYHPHSDQSRDLKWQNPMPIKKS